MSYAANFDRLLQASGNRVRYTGKCGWIAEGTLYGRGPFMLRTDDERTYVVSQFNMQSVDILSVISQA